VARPEEAPAGARSPGPLREAPSVSPVDGGVVGWYPITPPEGVAPRLAALRRAAAAWGELPLPERLRALRRLRRELAARADGLAAMLAREGGKPAVEACGAELLPTLRYLHWLERHAARLLAAERLPGRGRRVEYRPFGVVGLLTPWNYPVFLPVTTAAAALAAGNGVLWKPSELALGSSALVAEAVGAAGLGAVLAAVPGDAATGAALVEAGCDKVVFIGSEAVGRRVLARLAARLIPAVAELSGNDPLLVCADADLPAAARCSVWARCTAAGQTCLAPRRLYVEEQAYPRFLALLEEGVRALRTGSPLEPGCEVGPVRTAALREEALAAIAEAVAGGARLLCGGEALPGGGYGMRPALVSGCTERMRLFREPLHAPVMAVAPISSAEQAAAGLSRDPRVLTASVWTRNRRRAAALVAALPGSVVAVNDVLLPAARPEVPLGGCGISGWGRLRGAAGLREMVRTCTTDAARAGGWPGPPRRHLYPYRPGTAALLRAAVRLAGGAGAPALAELLAALRAYGREE
jgi:succinate-semialdehyde dehydrogenase/glutarate-semialdehyde dehydrogenase